MVKVNPNRKEGPGKADAYDFFDEQKPTQAKPEAKEPPRKSRAQAEKENKAALKRRMQNYAPKRIAVCRNDNPHIQTVSFWKILFPDCAAPVNGTWIPGTLCKQCDCVTDIYRYENDTYVPFKGRWS